MSRTGTKRVSFSPEAHDKPIFPKHGGFGSTRHNKKRIIVGILGFRLQKDLPVRLLRRIGTEFAEVLRFMSNGRSRKVSSSSSSNHLTRSRSLAESEPHRAEAIEDCIEFLNSSSSMSRSNSVSTCSCS